MKIRAKLKAIEKQIKMIEDLYTEDELTKIEIKIKTDKEIKEFLNEVQK